MPPSTSSHRRARLAAALAAAAATLAIGVGAGSADAAATVISGDPHSPVVIERANDALTAHDVFSYGRAPEAFVAYVAERNATADIVAFELGIDPIALRDAWAHADLAHQKAVLAALTQIGAPYVRNTSDPAVGFDCSGLTAFAWARAGLDLTRQSSAQINAARPIEQSEAMAGDLLQYPGHVMMYLGAGDAIVHAANHDKDIAIDFISRGVRFGDPTG
jgi:hypothetical protein